MLIAKEHVEIGTGCHIAWGVTICDHDFHAVRTDLKIKVPTKPVHIGNNVWIGMNATILKGVTVGDNSIIGAGSLVIDDVPKNCLVGGVPARVLKDGVHSV
jgi:acetyltransferase-like isoleucine patch superfamily enzyme